MKILIAYDGSNCAEAALDDLSRAGLPDTGEAMIVSVAEVWLPPPTVEPDPDRDETDEFIESIVETHRRKGELLVAEAERRIGKALDRFRTILPNWTVEPHTSYGSPSWEILSAARSFMPDLIIVGSQGHTALSRLLLGSVSQKVLTEAHCSVRVARGRVETEPSPTRILLGFDGSNGSMAAVRSVAARNWAPDTEIRLLSATDAAPSDEIEDDQWISEYSSAATQMLRETGLKVGSAVVSGNPNAVIVEEAERWHADCIFVGANAMGSRLERFLLGTTSSAVAGRAHCSVEVVREPAV